MKSHFLIVPSLLFAVLACSGQAPGRVEGNSSNTKTTENADATHSIAEGGQRGSVDLDPGAYAAAEGDAAAADEDAEAGAESSAGEENGQKRPEGRRGTRDSESQKDASGPRGPGEVLKDKLPVRDIEPGSEIDPESIISREELPSPEVMKTRIAEGLNDFSCARRGGEQVACQPVDANGQPVALPSDVKVEWFSSEGREETLSPVRADLVAGKNNSSAWALNMSDFSEKPVLVRLTRGSMQADMYVIPE